jgi:hypothetical protein
MTFNPKMILGTLLIAILFFACIKEQKPAGIILTPTITFTDSIYTTSQIPVAQARVVFVEEATGVHCVNCPAGAAMLRGIKAANPNRILSASIYSPFLNTFTAPSKYDFNTQDALDLVTFLGNVDPSKPSAAINRVAAPNNQNNTGNSYFYDRNDWNSVIANFLNTPTPVNLELNAEFINNAYKLNTKTTFTDNFSSDLAISLFVIEDGIVDLQDSTGVEIEDYEHEHVLRKILTPISGLNILATSPIKSKGTVLERTFYFEMPSKVLNKSNAKVLCFIHKVGSSKEILQVAEIDLP